MQSVRVATRRKPVCRHGALTVEMALITPVLLTLVFGVMQVGYAFMVQHALQDAARRGCRLAITPQRTNSVVTATVDAILQQQGISSSLTTTTILINSSSGDVATAQTGDDISVKVSMPLASATLFPDFFANFTGTMTGAVTLRCE